MPLLQFAHFKNIEGLVHGVTTRKGGISEGPFSSLNLGIKTGDDLQRVFSNRHQLLLHLGWDSSAVVIPNQVHSNNVVLITKELLNKNGSPQGLTLSGVDGLITKEKGILLLIKVADCIPVFLYDPGGPAIGLIHAGWRGTAEGIISRGVKAMQESLGSKPEDMKSGVGPGVGICCYEVKEDVWGAFSRKRLDNSVCRIDSNRQTFLDLKQAISFELIGCGVPEANIEIASECTFCNSDLFFSHRRDKGKTGRMAAVIGLR